VLRDQLRAGELVKNSYTLDGGRPLLERFIRHGRHADLTRKKLPGLVSPTLRLIDPTSPTRSTGNFIRADGGGAVYWISRDGVRVLRGEVADTADELQRGFIEAMARAGAEL
jgi:hypothetical protein